MGALHAGHASLIKAAAADHSPITVASVFVNPTQFAAGEDFETYPRTEDADLELLEQVGVDVAFLPTVDDIYPREFGTKVSAEPGLAKCLCGDSRGKEHFDGVATVVARLFGLVRPDTAWFGQKDWQQLQIIRRMAADIHPGVEVMGAPTIRDEDGLALSSRNAYLTEDQRARARAVPDSIHSAQAAANSGEPAAEVIAEGTRVLQAAGLEIDYFELRTAKSLKTVEVIDRDEASSENHPRLFVAARLGGVRLIDNQPLFATKTNDARSALTAPAAAATN
jgi:pantoate--beta-alanine ligase